MSDSEWQTFMKKLSADLRSNGGIMNVSKDDDLLSPSSKGAGTGLMYPADLFDHGHQAFIFFNIRESSDKTAPSINSICLYMPSQLMVQYQANWTDFTTPLEKVISAASKYYGLLTGQDNPQLSAAYNNIKSAISSGGDRQSVLNALRSIPEELQYLGVNASKAGLGPQYTAELKQALGKTLNPFAAVVYDNPEFRTFKFTFDLLPKNQKEAEQCRRIIKLFKLAMHPSKQTGSDKDLFWDFPYVFDVFLCTPWTDKMFMIKRSALTAADVNYSPLGVQSFFKDGHPVNTQLSLTFKELELLTRSDIENNY